MHRTQLLIPDDLHRRAAEAARLQGVSLGQMVREALAAYLDRSAVLAPSPEAIDLLLTDPYEDPAPDPNLSVDADHYLYGAPRKSAKKG